MDFRLLGPLEVLDGERPVAVGAGKRRSLLALLLLHRNEVLPSERLIDELWGERPPATAAKSVHVYVSQLRKELGRTNGGMLETRGNGYVARVGPDELDVTRFERALADGRRALEVGDAARARDRLGEAVAAWRGPPLADFAYEPFAQREIARLEELRLTALEARIEADLELGRHADLVGELDALVAEHPLRERLRGQLMVALYRCGRQADALRVYRDGRRLLVSELGLEPGPALRELEAKILEHSPELLPARGPPAGAASPANVAAASPAATAAPVLTPGHTPVDTVAPPRRGRRPATAIVIVAAGAALLGVTALAALGERGGGADRPPRIPLDLAPNTLAAVDAGDGAPRLSLPLPGRPTDLAVVDGTVWAVTADSAGLTAVDPRAKRILRSVPLPGTPSAVAVAAGAAWVADGRRGILHRIEPGYAEASAIPFRSGRAPPRATDATSVAVGAGGVWVTDGSTRLVRVDPVTRAVERIPAGRRLEGVTVAAGAVWAISSATPGVLRIDPRTGAVTARIELARAVDEAPFPVGLAASAGALWVLNGNTATVAQIDPRTREIVAVVPIGVDRVPNEIAAADTTAWVANEDGTLSRIAEGARSAGSVTVGESLRQVAPNGAWVWVATTAIDQQMPGGAG